MAGGKELKLAISIGGKIDKSLGAAINNAQSQLNKIGNISNKVGMAATAAVVAGTTKIANDSIKAYTSYESALNSAAATAGVEKGTAAYEQMNAAAREAGATTVKTAKESAEALEYMALAGWSVEDSTKALTPILKLSAASGMELATTSDLVTDSMAAMGLGINDLGRYLDVLAKGNNSANYKTQQLLESYINVGGVLRNLNVPVEKSAAVLGVMANQGLKGAEAGTALNAILVNMQKKSGDSYKAMTKLGVSMYDSAGNARDLLQVFQDVHDKTAGMTEEQRNLMYQMIGGKAHVADFAMIMNGFAESAETGTAQVYDLEKAYNGAQGTLDKFYDIKTDTLEGSITRLNSAYEGMLLNIGERLAPTVSNAVSNLVEKMPQIENAIVSFLEEIIPLASKVIDLLTKNPDKVIKTVTGIAKAFMAFKALKGITQIATLAKDIKTLTKAAGGLSVLKGATGAITGMGTAGSVAGAGLVSLGAAAPYLAIFAAAVTGGVIAYKAWDKATYHWADDLAKLEKPIAEHSNNIKELGDLSAELSSLQLVVKSPDSSVEDISNAQKRIQEIADLLSDEYGLHINVDADGLDEAADKVQEIVNGLNYKEHMDLAESTRQYIGELQSLIPTYQEAVAIIPEKTKTYNEKAAAYETIRGANGAQTNLQFAMQSFELTGDIDTYATRARAAVQQVLDAGMKNEFSEAGTNYGLTLINGMVDALQSGDASKLKLAADDIETIYSALNDLGNTTKTAFDNANKELTAAQDNAAEFDDITNKVSADLATALRADVLTGNTAQIENVTNQFEQLGETMVTAGANTDTLLKNFALAKQGFTEVAEATAEGDEAVQALIADMAQMGGKIGAFGDLDAAGIADKLSDMAHAMGLIPENKTITINAEGNYDVITAAENQIASLNSIGNVDVSVNANGDFAVLDEATNKMQILEGLGAVSLQVNADGNIDVLDKTQQVIATIDSKSAKVNVNGSVTGMDKIQQAVENENELTDVNVEQIVTGDFPGMGKISQALQYQTQLQDKTVTYKVIYQQDGTPPGHNAAGTPSWRGGLTWLNDQPGISDPREVVEYKGRRYWFGGRNVLADIPQGARIYNAQESRNIISDDDAEEYNNSGGTFGRAIDRLRYTRSESGGTGGSAGGGMVVTYSPNITVEGNADEAAITRALRGSYDDFKEFMERYEREKRRTSFDVA